MAEQKSPKILACRMGKPNEEVLNSGFEVSSGQAIVQIPSKANSPNAL
ncbi:MAG: hypothetical protein AAFY76_15905 [Cyanobacteria bacterium J06649_11]